VDLDAIFSVKVFFHSLYPCLFGKEVMKALMRAVALSCLVSCVGEAVADEELTTHGKIYQRWWDKELELNFDKLPTAGRVPDSRMPYSGYYYPDVRGGTQNALRKYDYAFNGRRLRATAFEQWDTTAYAQPTEVERRGGLFGLRRVRTVEVQTPNWHGHCNGWSAAAIRHAEPARSVVRNGMKFTPADIKALLAEIYMYSQYEELEGSSNLVDAAGLHITLANWLGRESHPLAMEAMPGREKWNYPVYGFESSTTRRGSNRVDVRTSLYYLYYTNGEYQQSPRLKRNKSFHYALNLDDQGNIKDGYFYNDSSRIDLLWVPLYPAKGGTSGNPRGNPHINVDEVLAIWRASVSDDSVAGWVNIDPKGESLLPPTPAPQIAAEGTAAGTVAPAGHTEPAPATSGEATTPANPPAEEMNRAETPDAPNPPAASDPPAGNNTPANPSSPD
jgi:hypothetical protein